MVSTVSWSRSKTEKTRIKQSFAWRLSKSKKAGQEQFSRPTGWWGGSVLPVQVWLRALTERMSGMGACNECGCSDSYFIDVWKRRLRNTCELNEPCRGWECVHFSKSEEDKLDKACKRPFGSYVLSWNRFDSCSGNANFFFYKKCLRFGENRGLCLLMSVLRVFFVSLNSIQKRQILPW